MQTFVGCEVILRSTEGSRVQGLVEVDHWPRGRADSLYMAGRSCHSPACVAVRRILTEVLGKGFRFTGVAADIVQFHPTVFIEFNWP